MFVDDGKRIPFPAKIWLSSPTVYPDSMRYVQEAYETNWMSTVGENIQATEQVLSQKVGRKYGVALSCGTAALHLAVKLAGVRRGDVVFCSDLTFAATVNPVLYEGAVPVFIDTEYDTWNMDPAALEEAFCKYPQAKACVLAHLYGTPAKLQEIQKVCDRHGAVLIEDAAESLGATYQGGQTGAFGAISCISFNGNKIITGSSGGMLLTDSREMAELAAKWSTQSRDHAPWYQHTQVGYNYRMSNVIAGIVRGQIGHLEEHIARKKEIYIRYREGLRDLPVTMNPLGGEDVCPNFWLSCMLIAPEAMCPQVRTEDAVSYTPEPGKSCPAEILETLQKFNIEGRPIWKPMHLQPIFRESGFVTRPGVQDAGQDIFHRGLCLPSDIKMTKEQQQEVIEIIHLCFA